MFRVGLADIKNLDLFRRKMNTIFEAYGAGYGSALPSASAYPDGKLWYVGSQGYQNRSNTWVAL